MERHEPSETFTSDSGHPCCAELGGPDVRAHAGSRARSDTDCDRNSPPRRRAAPATAKPAQTTTATAATAPIDGGWPRAYDLPSGGNILLYQPQIASGRGRKTSSAFSAVSYRPKAGDKPVIGTIKLEAATDVSLEERLVNLKNLKIVEANFQTLQKEQVREVTTVIDKTIPLEDRVIALDRVLANIDKSQIVPKNVEGIKADPPGIFFSKTSAVIVNLDGEPIGARSWATI